MKTKDELLAITLKDFRVYKGKQYKRSFKDPRNLIRLMLYSKRPLAVLRLLSDQLKNFAHL